MTCRPEITPILTIISSLYTYCFQDSLCKEAYGLLVPEEDIRFHRLLTLAIPPNTFYETVLNQFCCNCTLYEASVWPKVLTHWKWGSPMCYQNEHLNGQGECVCTEENCDNGPYVHKWMLVCTFFMCLCLVIHMGVNIIHTRKTIQKLEKKSNKVLGQDI